ncbi:hypothetical protein AA0242T_2196 [Acetobacter aceti NRIC 0242]|uniref:Uncharacterized protein n=3 Tax=Acetobacteraceae TaxID=433 RepID=A0A6S6PNA3_ACEAC|nr:hypothetical protein AAJCM20276_08260 [Acetobacter aceti]BCK77162.1 hypothetical protein EMQ_2768 [Acetobacter aceti NBRC 14818]GAN58625.1 hypothetical protein Abac_059_024 [Acetobacter aceti NBRC 14818]GBO81494.1 hypothetical protein AA0242T_2196 [Acetobacter aceti NRIC 0242]
MMETPALWPQPDGTPVSCTEKLLVLRQNWEELQGVMQDAFEDAVLMGVDEAEMKKMLTSLVASLTSPRGKPSV